MPRAYLHDPRRVKRAKLAETLVSKPATSTPTPPRRDTASVWVACDQINGHQMNVYEWVDEPELGSNNGRTVKVSRMIQVVDDPKNSNSIVLKGPNTRDALNSWAPQLPGADGTFMGYGLTQVPTWVWELYKDQQRDNPLIKYRHIFAATSEDRCADECKELASGGMRTGLEPINVSSIEAIKRRLGVNRIGLGVGGKEMVVESFEGPRY